MTLLIRSKGANKITNFNCSVWNRIEIGNIVFSKEICFPKFANETNSVFFNVQGLLKKLYFPFVTKLKYEILFLIEQCFPKLVNNYKWCFLLRARPIL
jgi:hypothetical protein